MTKTKYKAGDLVEVISNEHNMSDFKIGDTFRINEVYVTLENAWYRHRVGQATGVAEDSLKLVDEFALADFELVKDEEFKLGDNVICVGDSGRGCGWKEGKVFVIDKVNKTTSGNCYFPKVGNGCFEEDIKLYSKDSNFKNIKIHVRNETESKAVQERLFEFGALWNGDLTARVLFTDSKFLYCEDKKITQTNGSDSYFTEKDAREVTPKELLGYEIADMTLAVNDGDMFYNAEFGTESDTIKNKNEVTQMELKNIKPGNLTEAKKQIDEENINAEISAAKVALSNAIDNINQLDRQIAALEEDKRPHQEIIDKFDVAGKKKP